MAHLSVDVSAALVAPLRESAVLLYQATAESLHFSLRALVERRGSLEEIAEHRARLARLDALLGQLGWSREGYPRRPLRLTAPREVLHDMVYGALLDAGERLAEAYASSWRGEVDVASVRALALEVIALDRLLRRVEAGGES
jgi:hypothetical protein